ncbi:hypothetical protein R3P38DRAFT_3304868 [Favolaschia claudopus]|uniref:F-box domain-containing protein n=1 Tax=Favolaschia claudopus TaxID=2862362 RepID=A0AAW0DX06_9AGAR
MPTFATLMSFAPPSLALSVSSLICTAPMQPPPESGPPITSIPSEILCYIFTLVPVSPRTDSSPIPVVGPRGSRVLSGPWIFGQVCSQWRALALAFPALWTPLTIFATTLTAREYNLLHVQLERTREAPLDLHIRFAYYSGKEFDTLLHDLVNHSQRWRSLHFEADGSRAFQSEAFSTLGPDSLPLLQELVFGGTRADTLTKYDFFKDAPALRRVVLGAQGGAQVWPIVLPWAQLTVYKATYPQPAKHFHILALASNLVECDIDGGYSQRDDISHVLCTLPKLRRLAISKPSLLRQLRAPALQSLYSVGPVEDVLAFLDSSGSVSTLRELTLSECRVPTHELLDLFGRTHGLIKLAVDPVSPLAFNKTMLSAFMAPDCLCKNLGSISVTDFKDELDRHAFADMIASRCQNLPGIRRPYFVGVYSGRVRMKTAGHRIRELGMEVELMTSRLGKQAVRDWRGYSNVTRERS